MAFTSTLCKDENKEFCFVVTGKYLIVFSSQLKFSVPYTENFMNFAEHFRNETFIFVTFFCSEKIKIFRQFYVQSTYCYVQSIYVNFVKIPWKKSQIRTKNHIKKCILTKNLIKKRSSQQSTV